MNRNRMNFILRIWSKLKIQKLYFPLFVYDRFMSDRRVEKSKPYWDSLKDKHKGQRGFVIGNGPSLKMDDLERLKDELTIASNKIYLAFDQVSWRPSYFTSCDKILWPKIRNEVGHYFEKIHLAHNINGIPFDVAGKIRSWRVLSGRLENQIPFSSDFSEGAFGGGTVTYENLQLAVHLGLNPIYIIGCDHFYGGESDISGDEVLEIKDQQNHFIKGYRKPGEKVNSANVEKMNRAYQCARDFADQNEIKIYNATRGGFLDSFERADFDSIV